ncbi:MAG: isochorismatase family protein [Verrucomicrobia bacterium]|nr:isochorismatase family protein [Verrucomicrobiota bacterium]
MKALILVDMQRDFLPEGAWELPGAEAVVAVANRIQRRFRIVAATQDWHMKSHKIFAINHDNRSVGEVISFKKQEFRLTVPHCVQKTPGAELAPALNREFIQKVFYRGMDSDVNGSSAFLENDRRTSTGLTEFLRARKASEVWVMGFSPDGAVLQTALDAQSLGFPSRIIEDGVAMPPQTLEQRAAEDAAIDEAGIVRVPSAAI